MLQCLKFEGKIYPCTCHKGAQKEQNYSFCHSQLLHQIVVSGQIHAIAALSPVPCYWRLCGLQGWSGHFGENKVHVPCPDWNLPIARWE